MAVTKKARTNSGVTPYSGSFGNAEILHLLKRCTFGASKDDLDFFSGKTMNQVVDAVLNIDYTPPTPPLNNYNTPTSIDPNVPAGQTWVNDYNGTFNGQRQSSFKRWWVGQMINQDRTIREKLVLFWHNHFATELNVYAWANMAYTQNAMLRANCMKNFKDLVKNITIDPAMLIFLNGERNTKTAPDENYSRELQELFTLGKGPDSQYTEDDVIEGARVLTGWRVNRTNGTSYFDPARHDEGNKTFSSFYNDFTITGKTGTNGADEFNDMIAMIFNEFEVAKFIARKFYRWFVYYEIDANTETDVITPLANTFRNANYDIKPMLEQLFKSEHFFDVANRGALIKSPMDFMVGLMRQFEISSNNTYIGPSDPGNNVFPTSSNIPEQYYMWYLIQYFGAIQQQNIGDPPGVAGWSAYYQVPQFHELWINSDTLPNRNKVSDYIAAVGYTYNGFRMKIDSAKLADKFSNVANPTLFIQDLIDFFFTLDVNQDQKDYMKSILLAGQVQDFYWTNDWNAYKAGTPGNTAETKLTLLFKYFMNLSEYQLS
ncbi:MAG: DUF1800 domain-containing protein [Bacteroidia bacterium]